MPLCRTKPGIRPRKPLGDTRPSRFWVELKRSIVLSRRLAEPTKLIHNLERSREVPRIGSPKKFLNCPFRRVTRRRFIARIRESRSLGPPCPVQDPSCKVTGIVWQPNSSQWRVIWVLAAAVIFFWPTQQNHSLAIKALNWGADPTNKLPRPPANFTMEDGEDTEVVEAHDTQEADYERAYASSGLEGMRIRLRDMQEPLDPTTEQQILIAVVVLGGLLA